MGFPSPCGVWVVSGWNFDVYDVYGFPSPCGVWVVSMERLTFEGNFCEFPSPYGVWVVSCNCL